MEEGLKKTFQWYRKHITLPIHDIMSKTIIITGGAGFIGSHVVRLFVTKYPDYKIINLDALPMQATWKI